MNIRRTTAAPLSPRAAKPASAASYTTLREEDFLRVIWHERKRAERSNQPSVLMLIEMENQFPFEKNDEALKKILTALAATTRETDVTGWYKDDCVVGVMFTEITFEERNSIVTTVMNRVSDGLRSRLSARQFNQASISFHVFPEEHDERTSPMPGTPALYPELAAHNEAERLVRG
jgi:hypothetical protein